MYGWTKDDLLTVLDSAGIRDIGGLVGGETLPDQVANLLDRMDEVEALRAIAVHTKNPIILGREGD